MMPAYSTPEFLTLFADFLTPFERWQKPMLQFRSSTGE